MLRASCNTSTLTTTLPPSRGLIATPVNGLHTGQRRPPAKSNPTGSSDRKEYMNRNASTATRAYVSKVTTH